MLPGSVEETHTLIPTSISIVVKGIGLGFLPCSFHLPSLSEPVPKWDWLLFACPYAASVVALYRVSDIVPFGARFRVKVPI